MEKPNIQPNKDYIVVQFDEQEAKVHGTDIIIPERYLIQEGDETENSAYGVTTDRRLINPQVVTVIQGNETVPTGVKAFVHYGAYEVAQWIDDKNALIKSAMVFFTLDPITPLPGNYLGEEVFIEGDKTDSGIYITPYAEMKLPINIKITHVSKNSEIQVGDEVITIDSAQYPLKYEDKTYIKLRDSEIVAIKRDGNIIPYRNYLLVEYIDTIDEELIQQNYYKDHLKDVAIKYRLHVPDIDFTHAKESKHVDAKLIAIGSDCRYIKPTNSEKTFLYAGGILEANIGSILKIDRNRGARLDNGQWIINLDTVLWVYKWEGQNFQEKDLN